MVVYVWILFWAFWDVLGRCGLRVVFWLVLAVLRGICLFGLWLVLGFGFWSFGWFVCFGVMRPSFGFVRVLILCGFCFGAGWNLGLR